MGKLTTITNFGNIYKKQMINPKLDLKKPEEQETFKKELNDSWLELVNRFNDVINNVNRWSIKVREAINRVNLIYQTQGVLVTITITVINTSTVMAHGLNYTPSYFVVVDSDIAGYICKGDTWDGTNVTFKAGATGTLKAIVW